MQVRRRQLFKTLRNKLVSIPATVAFLLFTRLPDAERGCAQELEIYPSRWSGANDLRAMDLLRETGMTIQDVFNLLKRNGATNTEAANLAGISVFEAGGGNPQSINPQALNDNARTQDYSVGLFQFNFRAGNFNPSNPLSSTRGGYSASQLLGDVNAQAQSALSLLRGSASGYRNWTTWIADQLKIQNYASQLLGGNTDNSTDTPEPSTGSDSGSGTGSQLVGSPSSPTSMNLGFNDSIQHTMVQILLVVVGISLLLGGMYLIGSSK